jgi:glycerol-3-phosphate acyltransferase PlsY
VIALVVFVIIVALTRYVSLGSLLAALTFLVVLILQKYVFDVFISNVLIYLSVVIVALIWYAHRSNIKRLLQGNENKIEFKKSE